jgi:toxin-antitoxin system PIN domain toxin
VNSIDTNVLLYALNEDCPEHGACRALLEDARREPRRWVVAHQVWFELYRLVRNPAVLQKPLDAPRAAAAVNWYRERTGWLSCGFEPDMMGALEAIWSKKGFAGRNTFDAVLAVTLKCHGVKTLYTRNTKDFLPFGFFAVTDPVDG